MDKELLKKINTVKYLVELPKSERNDNIVAFGELHLIDYVGNEVFKVRGFTLRLIKPKKADRPILTVNFPGYFTRGGFRKSFVAEDKDFFKEMCENFIKQYIQESGNLSPQDLEKMGVDPEMVDLDKKDPDIPF